MTRKLLIAAALCGLLVSTAAAQSDDEMKAKELISRIKKQLSKIDELLLDVEGQSPASARESMQRVQKDLDELLEDVQSKQGSVCNDIEELVRLTKYTQSNQGGGESDKDQESDGEQQKNRERQRDKQPEDLKYQGQPEQPEQKDQGEKPEGEQEPKSGEEDQSDPKQSENNRRPPPDEIENFERDDVSGRWGNLPPKIAEEFMNLSPDRFPAKYRKLLEEYYKKANDQKKDR